MAILSAGFFVGVLGFAARARQRPVRTGAEQMIGSTGEVVSWARRRRAASRCTARSGRRDRARASPRARRSASSAARAWRSRSSRAPDEEETCRTCKVSHHLVLGRAPASGHRRDCRLFDPHPARVRARRGVSARPVLEGEGPGPRHRRALRPADGAHGPAHARARRAAAGRDLQGQRLGQGQRRRLLPGDRSGEGGDPGRAVRDGDQPVRADDAALGPRAARPRSDAGRARKAQRRSAAYSGRAEPTPGASRSATSSSSTSTSTRP